MRNLVMSVAFCSVLTFGLSSDALSQVHYIGFGDWNQYVNGMATGVYDIGDKLESKDEIEVSNRSSTATLTATIKTWVDGANEITIGPFTVPPLTTTVTPHSRSKTASNGTMHTITAEVTVTGGGPAAVGNNTHIYTKN